MNDVKSSEDPTTHRTPVITIGWREWLVLPDLGIPAIKAKIDTGARSSSLHAHFIEKFEAGGKQRIKFKVRPLRKRKNIEFICVADLLDVRRVKDSGGHTEQRYFIRTKAVLAGHCWTIDISLTSRKDMLFRMLLGRNALADHFTIDPGRSYTTGRNLARSYSKE